MVEETTDRRDRRDEPTTTDAVAVVVLFTTATAGVIVSSIHLTRLDWGVYAAFRAALIPVFTLGVVHAAWVAREMV